MEWSNSLDVFVNINAKDGTALRNKKILSPMSRGFVRLYAAGWLQIFNPGEVLHWPEKTICLKQTVRFITIVDLPMPSCAINRSTLKISLLALLITGLLVLFVNGSSHPALDPQLDDHSTPTLISVDGSGDSSSPDVSVAITSPRLFPEGDLRAVFSTSLDFIQPPSRLLSYPVLPQGPPRLA
ncbi:hypothetical protein [Marinobacter sp.]|uniref:hypothetical protein n=1 Tax=Marinobacter sp. TaxID=50741 RepID=UPI003A8FE03A